MQMLVAVVLSKLNDERGLTAPFFLLVLYINNLYKGGKKNEKR